MPTLDFTSALYLGLRHRCQELKPWHQLTTGRPAALAEPLAEREIGHQLASLQGCEAGTLGPSTLHLFWDLFGQLAKDRVAVYVDGNAYPIALWGAERAGTMGAQVRRFCAGDPAALWRRLESGASSRRRPVVLADGFSPALGGAAPLASYLEAVRAFGGLLVIDDSQALGVLGRDPGWRTPYGSGGGGSLRWGRIAGGDVIVVSSLAKGFGVPLAVLAGSHEMVAQFQRDSETRVHCSPPSQAALSAAEHALTVNREQGDALRLHLARLVRRFRSRLIEIGLHARAGLFPMQTLSTPRGCDASTLHERLLRAGVRTVLRRGSNGHGSCISFLLTARHTLCNIDRAIEVLRDLTQPRLCMAHEKASSHSAGFHGQRSTAESTAAGELFQPLAGIDDDVSAVFRSIRCVQ